MLHLRLRVKKIDETPDGEYVRVFAELQIQQTQQDPLKERIVQVGIPCSDEEQMAKDVMGQMQKLFEQRGMFPMPKPVGAEICMFMKKQHFYALGRPTVDDYIELDARTDRSSRR